MRSVLAPVAVAYALGKDDFLGPALVDKCCLEGTIPRGFDEELDLGGQWKESYLDDRTASFDRLEDIIIDELAADEADYRVLRRYPSWHSYRTYMRTIGIIAGGCQATVANFDRALGLFAKDLSHVHSLDANSENAELPPGQA